MTYKLFFLVIGMYYLLKKSKFYFQFLRIFGGKLKWKINTGMIGSKKFRFFSIRTIYKVWYAVCLTEIFWMHDLLYNKFKVHTVTINLVYVSAESAVCNFYLVSFMYLHRRQHINVKLQLNFNSRQFFLLHDTLGVFSHDIIISII